MVMLSSIRVARHSLVKDFSKREESGEEEEEEEKEEEEEIVRSTLVPVLKQ